MVQVLESGYGFKRHVSATLHPRWSCAVEGCRMFEAWSQPMMDGRKMATTHTAATGHRTLVSRETVDSYIPARDPSQLKPRR